jgi:putative phosphoribosyl transferase
MTTTQSRGQPVAISAGAVELEGELALAAGAAGLVIFAHGSGSSRFSPRNQFVARALRERRLGTLLFDLLTPDEEQIDELDGRLRFDVPFLARRLAVVTAWARQLPAGRGHPVGYFGASTGAAAALIAAADRPDDVQAVVSRGGRPDLAAASLPEVQAPTLLIVGGDDTGVLELNRRALRSMRTRSELSIVAGATHLFEERGALEEVARLAGDWFETYLHRSAEDYAPISP